MLNRYVGSWEVSSCSRRYRSLAAGEDRSISEGHRGWSRRGVVRAILRRVPLYERVSLSDMVPTRLTDFKSSAPTTATNTQVDTTSGRSTFWCGARLRTTPCCHLASPNRLA